MNKNHAQVIRNSNVWNRNFSDYDDILENGILKCSEIADEKKIILSILRTGQLIEDHIREELRKINLSIPQLSILEVLYFAKGVSITQSQLSKRVFSSKANISTIIVRMIDKKLILRTENKENKREKLLEITDIGSKLLEGVLNSYEKCNMNFFKKEESKLLLNSLSTLRSELKL